ncbi:hypothetical protein WDZ92_21660 [Nostoc sp. NIES-2111]
MAWVPFALQAPNIAIEQGVPVYRFHNRGLGCGPAQRGEFIEAWMLLFCSTQISAGTGQARSSATARLLASLKIDRRGSAEPVLGRSSGRKGAR